MTRLLDLSSAIDLEQFVLDGDRIDVRLVEAITEANAERTMEGASTVTLTVHDPDYWLIRESDLLGNERLKRGVRLEVDDLPFVLSEVDKIDQGVTLTFYDEAVAKLKARTGARKASRSQVTRAEFAGMLAHEAGVKIVSPDQHTPQQVADFAPDDVKTLRKARKSQRRQESRRGLTIPSGSGLTVERNAITTGQLRIAERILAAGIDKRVKFKVLLSGIVAAMNESRLSNPHHGDAAGPDSRGAFQQRASWGPESVRLDPYKSAGLYYDKAIERDRKFPDVSVAQLVALTQFPGASSVTAAPIPLVTSWEKRWVAEATKIVNAFGLTAKGYDPGYAGSPDTAYVERYEFARGKHENSWAAMTRLAEEVGWRCFAVGGRVWFVSDFTLIRADPSLVMRDRENGVDELLWTWTAGRRIDEVTATVRAVDWPALPGAVVVVEGEGPANGLWLVRSLERDLLDPAGTLNVTLGQPQAPKLEPASTVHSSSGSDPTGGSAGTGSGDGLRAIGPNWTPKSVIDRLVLSVGRDHGAHSGLGATLNPENVKAANAAHTHLGSASDHAGPPSVKWAVDLSIGSDVRYGNQDGAKRGDAIAKELAAMFGITWTGSGIRNGTHKGFRFQLIWRYEDAQAGNHYTHVHFGVRKA